MIELIKEFEMAILWLACYLVGECAARKERKMINNVTLVGRLTKDPELKYTPSNVAVATLLWRSIGISREQTASERRISSTV